MFVISYVRSGGEKFKDVIARVKPWIEELQTVIKTHEPVVVVTHPAVIRALVCICIGEDDRMYACTCHVMGNHRRAHSCAMRCSCSRV